MNDQDDVLVSLRRIIRATDQNSKRLGRSTGLTVPQIVLMRAIAAHPDTTLGFLTERVNLSQATVTTILDRLEERELVVRRRNTKDKRVVNVALTASGESLLKTAPQPLQEAFRERFALLPQPQQAWIVRSLDTVAGMMDAQDIDAAPILTLGTIPEQLPSPLTRVRLRAPAAEDGPGLHGLVRICPPLDINSRYCNLLQCLHFPDTAVIAERDGQLVGAITGYRLPMSPETLFIWQVATHPDLRGNGLGKRMLAHLLAREALRDIRYLETSVTEGNRPSTALFTSLAKEHGCAMTRTLMFAREQHFGGSQDNEWLLRIGPLASRDAGQTSTSPLQAQEAISGA